MLESGEKKNRFFYFILRGRVGKTKDVGGGGGGRGKGRNEKKK